MTILPANNEVKMMFSEEVLLQVGNIVPQKQHLRWGFFRSVEDEDLVWPSNLKTCQCVGFRLKRDVSRVLMVKRRCIVLPQGGQQDKTDGTAPYKSEVQLWHQNHQQPSTTTVDTALLHLLGSMLLYKSLSDDSRHTRLALCGACERVRNSLQNTG
jgi:hypothetical protein